jgi:tetratricopeptide (TPR) repeat protein
VGVRSRRLGTLVLGLLVTLGPGAFGATPDERFDEANDLARAGDYPKAISLYHELAASGQESASLYWNWAQAASARGERGEALWALLRARELDPADRAVRRQIETLREALNLDPAEIAPEPLAAAARLARRLRLDVAGVVLLALSLAAHVLARLRPGSRWPAATAWVALSLGLLAAAAPIAGVLARSTGTVIRRGAPLLDAASPTAEAIGALREGEVVPILEPSGNWLRVEDASGARGWAHVADVRRLDVPPAAADR